jgi:chromosome segregation ATPase
MLLVAREKELDELKSRMDFARVEELERKLEASEGALQDMTLRRDTEAQMVDELKKKADTLAAEKEEGVHRCEELQQLLAREKATAEQLSIRHTEALRALEVEKAAQDAEIVKLRAQLVEAEKLQSDAEQLAIDASTFGFERCQEQITRRFPNHGLDLTALDPYELEDAAEPEP